MSAAAAVADPGGAPRVDPVPAVADPRGVSSAAASAWAGVIRFLAADERWRRWLESPSCSGCRHTPHPCDRCATVTGWAMTARAVAVARDDGERCRLAREAVRMSREQLAARVGVGIGTIHRLEIGVPVGARVRRIVGAALGVGARPRGDDGSSSLVVSDALVELIAAAERSGQPDAASGVASGRT